MRMQHYVARSPLQLRLQCEAVSSNRNKRATTIQAWVRMHQQQARFRRETEMGRRAADRAAAAAQVASSAVVTQKYARRVLAQRKVSPLLHSSSCTFVFSS